jgi:hypothetical protein
VYVLALCAPGMGPRCSRPSPRPRMVVYVCMTPRAWATEEVLMQRVDAYARSATCTHWPHKFVEFPVLPHHLDFGVASKPQLTVEQRKLLGELVES